jgi:hypothetical protein
MRGGKTSLDGDSRSQTTAAAGSRPRISSVSSYAQQTPAEIVSPRSRGADMLSPGRASLSFGSQQDVLSPGRSRSGSTTSPQHDPVAVGILQSTPFICPSSSIFYLQGGAAPAPPTLTISARHPSCSPHPPAGAEAAATASQRRRLKSTDI